MKTLQKFSIVFILIIGLISCSSSDDSPNVPVVQNISASYIGDWSGTFSGGDAGTWDINVSSIGVVTGTAISTTFSDSYDINGTVSNTGALTATVGTSSAGAIYTGQLTTNATASGTWINTGASLNGNWQGTKN